MLVEEAIPANLTGSRALQQYIFSILQTCNTIKKLKQIHTQIVINGFSNKNYLIVKLLSFYITSGNLLNAHKVFDRVENPSTSVWNQMIRGHSQGEAPQKLIELYNRMVEDGAEAEPNGFTYSFVIGGCARSRLLREGEQMHGRVVANGYYTNVFVQTNLVNLYVAGGGDDGMGKARRVFDEMIDRNVVSWNSLLAGYVRCGDLDGARRVFDEMPERNVVSWTTMIAGCAQNGRCKQSLNLFHEMRRASIELDQVVLVAALSACAELGDLRVGKWIHTYIEEKLNAGNRPLLVSLNNSLIHMYSSCGVIDKAYEIFMGMQRRSIVSWTSMITGFAKQGYAEEALEVFQWMQCLGTDDGRPDGITLLGVLCACSHAGFVYQGRQFFKCMNQNWGIVPRIEHYGCMVDLLSRAGFLDEAHRLVKSMPMRPNDAVWGALLGGCRIHKNDELASHVAQNLILELDPDRAAGYLVLLSNVYATAKRWQDVALVREKMVKMGVRKPAGRSWVQINGVVHDFVVGDWTHKHASSIYEMLSKITRQAKLEGYKLDFSEVILDVE